MSTALYRRYRPESFADVIGQEHVTEPLMTALEKNRVNHAYLFSGPRGCGKTTSARILARCLNCAQGPTPTPCGVCESCKELSRDGGGSLDVIEMDAASHGGVDHARDLRERATFAPVRDRYKIFIIDEAHMVTREGFNALLKIVEEPPAHIKFIFATTEPNKVLGTIRSRTHHYPFRLVPPQILGGYLAKLCAEEGVKVADGVLPLVVRAGGGSVRDSLSILDQLMAGASDEQGISYDLAVALLGFTHGELLDEVVDAFASGSAAEVFASVDRVVQTGQDPRRFVEDLLERFRDLIIVKAVPDSAGSILRGLAADQLDRMRAQAEQLGSAELSRAADVTNEALNEMSGAMNPQLHLELLCARILLAAGEQAVGNLAARLDRLERRLASGQFPAPAGGGSGQAGSSGTGADAASPLARARQQLAQQGSGAHQGVDAGQAPAQQGHSQQQPPVRQGQHNQPDQQGPPQQQAQPGQQTQAPTQPGGAPLAAAPLAGAPVAGAPLSGAPLAGRGVPPLGGAQSPAQQPQGTQAGQQASAPLANTGQQTSQVPQQTRISPAPQNPAHPVPGENTVDMVANSWADVVAKVPSAFARVQFALCEPSKFENGALFLRAELPVLKAVKEYLPQLQQALFQVLGLQVQLRGEIKKPGDGGNPGGGRPGNGRPGGPGPSGGSPAPNGSAQPTSQQVREQQLPADVAEGPRGGEQAWAAHGQPRSEEPPSWSPNDWNNPVTSWSVAAIPGDDATEAPRAAESVETSEQAKEPANEQAASAPRLRVIEGQADPLEIAKAQHPSRGPQEQHNISLARDEAQASGPEETGPQMPHEDSPHAVSLEPVPTSEGLAEQGHKDADNAALQEEAKSENSPAPQAPGQVQTPSQAPAPSQTPAPNQAPVAYEYADYDGGYFDDAPEDEPEYVAGVGYLKAESSQDAPAQPAVQPTAQTPVPAAARTPQATPSSSAPLAGAGAPGAPLAQGTQAPASAAHQNERQKEQQSQQARPQPATEQPGGKKLSFRERHAAQIAAGQRAVQQAQTPAPVEAPEDFTPSDDDAALESSVLIGQRAVEKILGGKVIDEQPLHQG
ncbi:MAG: DNA polymerase III subunit gamma and tau [Rothia sp. (in: high G+C Gram-positive bacteria)]|uniref:DNA polymerase III subunit gamma and tau n=1 Tax=Rothia sp. (in: high G+C Gram-positive bacteria) TaxID=1885016 RepID=UPI0026FF4BAD|nr:DNA polymerase III subunit gamma and tau [Rothia sp. (in: high G+C Gram-positive bacteria)]